MLLMRFVCRWWKTRMFWIAYQQIRHGKLLDRWALNRECEEAVLLRGRFVILPRFTMPDARRQLVVLIKQPRTGNWKVVREFATVQGAAQWAWEQGESSC